MNLLSRLFSRASQPPSDCARSRSGHKWRHEPYNLNSGFYHHGAIRREGYICEHCAKVRFVESNTAFFSKLPEWLQEELRADEQEPKDVSNNDRSKQLIAS